MGHIPQPYRRSQSAGSERCQSGGSKLPDHMQSNLIKDVFPATCMNIPNTEDVCVCASANGRKRSKAVSHQILLSFYHFGRPSFSLLALKQRYENSLHRVRGASEVEMYTQCMGEEMDE